MKMRKLLTGVVAAAMAVSTFAFAAVAEDTAAPKIYTYTADKVNYNYVFKVTETYNFAPVKSWVGTKAPSSDTAANDFLTSSLGFKEIPSTGSIKTADKTLTGDIDDETIRINGVSLASDGSGDPVAPTAMTVAGTGMGGGYSIAGIQNKNAGASSINDSTFSAGVYNSLTVTYDVTFNAVNKPLNYDPFEGDYTDITALSDAEIYLGDFTDANAQTAKKATAAGEHSAQIVLPSSIKVEVKNDSYQDAIGSAGASTFTKVDGMNMFSFKIAECESLLNNGATLTFNLAKPAKTEGFVNFYTNLNKAKIGVWFDKGATTSTMAIPASYMAKELGSEYQQNIITFSSMYTAGSGSLPDVTSIDLAIAPLAVEDDLDDVQGNPGEGDDADLAEDEEETVADEEETVADEEETVADEEETAAPTDDKNQPTGVALAIVPVAIAGAAAIVAKKRK